MIITCAVDGGIQGKESHPALPELPDEIALQSQEAYEAGASIVHIHGRDPGDFTNCTDDPEVYREILGQVREKCPDLILNITTGGGPTTTDEGRVAILDVGARDGHAEPRPGHGALRARGAQSRRCRTRARRWSSTCVMPFTYGFIDRLAGVMLEKGIKPELEIYQPGQYWVSRGLAERGLIKPPYSHQFVMGVQTAIYPTPWNVLNMLQELPGDSLFTVAAIGKFQWPLITMGIILGGNVRVGLEDNLYERRGRKLTGNGEAVEKVVRLAKEFGREIATPAQAREMLGLSATPSSY